MSSGALGSMFGGRMVGEVVPFAAPPSDGNWLYCDNSKVARASYPALSALFPAVLGTLTPTIRTPAATPTSNACASNGSIWALAGAAGTSGIRTTSDAVTFIARTTPASTDVKSILWLGGTNWVAAVLGSAQPLYSADDAVTWTAATGATTAAASAQQSCMAYAPALGGSNGRVCLAVAAANVYTSDDKGVTYTVRATGLGVNVFNVCWTGTNFVASTSATNAIATSADGITWTAVRMPWDVASPLSYTAMPVSDGAGRVAIVGNASGYINYGFGIAVSQDHGATWSIRTLPCYGHASQTAFLGEFCSYTNGRFIASGRAGLAMSVDLKTWMIVADASCSTYLPNVVHKSGGVYYASSSSGAASATFVEDTSKIYLPGQVASIAGANYVSTTHPQYMKVA